MTGTRPVRFGHRLESSEDPLAPSAGLFTEVFSSDGDPRPVAQIAFGLDDWGNDPVSALIEERRLRTAGCSGID